MHGVAARIILNNHVDTHSRSWNKYIISGTCPFTLNEELHCTAVFYSKPVARLHK